MTSSDSRHRRILARLLAGTAIAFAFGYALVPLYNVFCELTGINGRSRTWQPGGLVATAAPLRTDDSRAITVEFTGNVMPELAWEVAPLQPRMVVHPGEMHEVRYRVRNLAAEPLVGQAVPSVSPGQAARHFQKIECFCFREQRLAPGESREMPVVFVLRPEIDSGVHTVTLSYAFYRAPAQASRQ